jgi:SAM-dependent methyltransferase
MRLKMTADGRSLLHLWRCGTAFEFADRWPAYQEWNNLRFNSLPNENDPRLYRNYNLKKPLPFPDAVFDVVYCNHVLEHLSPAEGLRLLGEVRRVMKPGGLCRFVVPDLEGAAREYLDTLERVTAEDTPENVQRYAWAVADLIDQFVRRESGGDMGARLRAGNVDWRQVRRCYGDVFDCFAPGPDGSLPQSLPFSTRFRRRVPRSLRDVPGFVRFVACRLAQRLLVALSGRSLVDWLHERNQWYYDRRSLAEALRRAGFAEVRLEDYKTSRIDGWARYDFDRSSKRDYPLEPSVYAEGRKQAAVGKARRAA